ncbi:hypothetical protein PR202_ga05331 [Eleusine coracana subsp. coracana]|uniref:Malectin-like domain-containing protein n=1 Tax=Eleusine coracana subsp. coracana TaxID=191504 RepID=A0AAV5BT98_ELECO|nr:hypothetical protein PR202_ga04878 [Eleusine coracana subsp. coracana]GJM89171.1 hypothetical protein PR202_ga05331 [Eleusine coracana subsp. coracana]
MEESKTRSLVERSSWLLLLLLYLAAVGPAGVLQARAQPDSNGFISIDCGLAASSYVDNITKLLYHSDAVFTDGAGENYNIPLDSSPPRKLYRDLRSFPNGKRNCYTLRSLTAGSKYLLRASLHVWQL